MCGVSLFPASQTDELQLSKLSLFQVQPQKFSQNCIAGIETRTVYGIYAGGNIKEGDFP